MKGFTIGKLAEAAGVGVETIRYYERRGLIRRPRNDGSGYRQYPKSEIGRIRFIKNSQLLGFTLKEITTVLELIDGTAMNCAHAAELINLKLVQVKQKIEALHRMERMLKELHHRIGTCGGKQEMAFLEEFFAKNDDK